MEPIEFKPNLPEADERIRRWWERTATDRPVVSLHVQPSEPYAGPVSHHDTLRERWLDAEFRVEEAAARMARRDYPAEALPVFEPNLGPDLLATFFGAELRFSEQTSWAQPVLDDRSDWAAFRRREPDPENACWRAAEAMMELAIERGRGRFLVSCPNHHGNFDLLVALRGAAELCLDAADAPELVTDAAMHAADATLLCFAEYWRRVQPTGMGSTTWVWYRHPGPAGVLQCDFWSLISPEMGRRLVLPAVLKEMEPLERSVFHLDGPGALGHLESLLGIPGLDAVQWVQGAGGGPGSDWIKLYRRVLEAGKSVQCFVMDAEDARAVARRIGARGVWLVVCEPFQDTRSAERFLSELVGACRSG